MDTSKWNAEDRQLPKMIEHAEAKVAELRADSEAKPWLKEICDEYIARWEAKIAEWRALLAEIVELYAQE